MILKKFLIFSLLSLLTLVGCAGSNPGAGNQDGLVVVNNPSDAAPGTLKLSLSMPWQRHRCSEKQQYKRARASGCDTAND